MPMETVRARRANGRVPPALLLLLWAAHGAGPDTAGAAHGASMTLSNPQTEVRLLRGARAARSASSCTDACCDRVSVLVGCVRACACVRAMDAPCPTTRRRCRRWASGSCASTGEKRARMSKRRSSPRRSLAPRTRSLPPLSAVPCARALGVSHLPAPLAAARTAGRCCPQAGNSTSRKRRASASTIPGPTALCSGTVRSARRPLPSAP